MRAATRLRLCGHPLPGRQIRDDPSYISFGTNAAPFPQFPVKLKIPLSTGLLKAVEHLDQ